MPWIGYKLVDQAITTLKGRGIGEAEIAKGRLDLLDSIRMELAGKVDAEARAIFEQKLTDGLDCVSANGTEGRLGDANLR